MHWSLTCELSGVPLVRGKLPRIGGASRDVFLEQVRG